MNRRTLLRSAALAALSVGVIGRNARARDGDGEFEIRLSEAEWRKRLDDRQYAVLREHDTERAFTSPLLEEKRAGTYDCAGCRQPVYDAATKFDSGTGWPSFWQEIDGSVGTSKDYFLVFPRTEVHCGRCGGHLGHIFDDGPPPTGLRHCINGVALAFTPVGAS